MSMKDSQYMPKLAAFFGLASIGLFATAFIVFSVLNPDFNFLYDYVSKLGAQGQPYSLLWNLFGFLTVGLLLAVFGWVFGRVIQDRWVGWLMAMFGFGFTVTSIPVDMENERSALTVAHVAVICLGLAGWMIALARMAYLEKHGRCRNYSANIIACLVVLPIFGQVLQLWPMPLTHRMVFGVVFGWVAVTSVRLLLSANTKK